MKRSLIYVLVLAVMLTALGVWGINSGTRSADAAVPTTVQGDTVTYWLPYLTSDTTAPIYCVVSNMSTQTNNLNAGDDNVTSFQFTVLANEAGTASRTATGPSNFVNIKMKKTRLIQFLGQTIYLDSIVAIDLSGDVASSGAKYGGKLEFFASGALGAPVAWNSSSATSVTNYATNNALYSGMVLGGTLRSTFNCTSLGMACYQGTTTPKRNVVGYHCSDSGLYTSGGTNNVIGGIYAY
ncbi:MAG: hypothetical protein HQK99_00675 [Nitrospirae bacterium]|nr:hypothetical protein [Nitrospirota bacterium]